MSNYSTFLGIDIGKTEVVVALHGSKQTKAFPNSKIGFRIFFKEHKNNLSNAFVVLETTGGYENLFLNSLLDKNVSVHRANMCQVKNFIRSWGQKGKSDALDSQALALYGFERHKNLILFQKQDPQLAELSALAQRKYDLKKMLVQEKNRSKSPQAESWVIESCKKIIEALETQVLLIDKKMQKIIKDDPYRQGQQQVLETIPGIAAGSSANLLAYLPELGKLNRRQIASLCGLAPHPYESGQKIGYRRTKGGRHYVRSVLFMIALSACRSNSPLKAFYEKLIANGKKKMVALTALMRKIIVIANAKLKEFHSSYLIQ